MTSTNKVWNLDDLLALVPKLGENEALSRWRVLFGFRGQTELFDAMAIGDDVVVPFDMHEAARAIMRQAKLPSPDARKFVHLWLDTRNLGKPMEQICLDNDLDPNKVREEFDSESYRKYIRGISEVDLTSHQVRFRKACLHALTEMLVRDPDLALSRIEAMCEKSGVKELLALTAAKSGDGGAIEMDIIDAECSLPSPPDISELPQGDDE